MTIRDLLVDLGVRTDEAALKRFDQGLEKVKRGMKVAAKAAAALTAAVAGVTAAAYKTATATAAYGDRVAKTAKKVGVGVEALQEFEHAAQIGGASASDIEKGFRRLAKTASDFERGLSTATDAFKDVGVDPTDAEGKLRSMDDVIMDVAGAFGRMENETKKTALAQELFGRAGAQLVPFLEQGREGIADLRKEARKLGIVMSKDSAAAAEGITDTMLRFDQVALGLRNRLGSDLIPVFDGVIQKITGWVQANDALIDSGFKAFASFIDSVLNGLIDTIKDINAQVQEWGGWAATLETIAEWLQLIVSLAAGWYTYTTVIPAVTAAFGTLAAVLPAVWGQITALAGILWTGGIPAITAFASGIWAAIAPTLPFVAAAAAVAGIVYELWNIFFEGESAILSWIRSFETGRDALDAISDGFDTLVGWIETAADAIWTVLYPVWWTLETLSLGVIAAIVVGAQWLWDVLVTGFGYVRDFFVGAWNVIADAATAVFDWYIEKWTQVLAYFEPALLWLKDLFVSGAGAPILDYWMFLFDWFAAKFEWVVEKLKALRAWASSVTGMFDDEEQTVTQNVERTTSGGGSLEESVFANVGRDRKQRARQKQASRAFATANAPTAGKMRAAAQAKGGGVRDVTVEGTKVDKIVVNEASDEQKVREAIDQTLTEHEQRKMRRFNEMMKGGEY